MCPCPFCTLIAIILSPLLFWKKGRKWLQSKLKKHHKNCEVCQQAEHELHQRDHTPCSCRACHLKKTKATKTKKRKK